MLVLNSLVLNIIWFFSLIIIFFNEMLRKIKGNVKSFRLKDCWR